jgi:hypothetical protein
VTCIVDGCQKKRYGHGYCNMHWYRWRTHGDPGEAAPLRMKQPATCTVASCGRPCQARGWCATHYAQLHKPDKGECSVEDCNRPCKTRGLCNAHYQRVLRHGHTDALRPYEPRTGECTVDGCDRTQTARGFCYAHWERLRVYGDVRADLPLRQVLVDGVPSYETAHDRVVAVRGLASTYACVDCDSTAKDWSYDHQDPDELTRPIKGWAYSLEPEHYEPRCRRCHIRFDAKRTPHD